MENLTFPIILAFIATLSSIMAQMTLYPKPAQLLDPLQTAPRLILAGGAANPYPRAHAAMQAHYMDWYENETLQAMHDVKAGLRYLFQTESNYTVPVFGSGRFAMQVALENMIEEGDVILVPYNGQWAEYVIEMSTRFGADVRIAQKPGTTAFTYEEIELAVAIHRPKILFLIHGESTTGLLHTVVERSGELCRRYGCYTIVDAVATVGIQPFLFDEWGIDVAYANTQKAIGASVGLGPIVFSERAMNYVLNRRVPASHVMGDVKWWYDINYWFLKDASVVPGALHSWPVYNWYALREALSVIVEEGLEQGWERHRNVTEYMDRKMRETLPNFTYYVPNPEDRLIGTISYVPPIGIIPNDLYTYILRETGIVFSRGYGPASGQLVRLGLFGQNARMEYVDQFVAALARAVEAVSKIQHNFQMQDEAF